MLRWRSGLTVDFCSPGAIGDDLPTQCVPRLRLDVEGNVIPMPHRRYPHDLPDSYRETIARMRELRESGLCIRRVRLTLNEEGHKTIYGSKFTDTAVNRAMKSADALLLALDNRKAGLEVQEFVEGYELKAPRGKLHPDEIVAVGEAIRLYRTGDWSYRKLTAHINEAIPNPYGRQYCEPEIRNMVIGRFRFRHAPQHAGDPGCPTRGPGGRRSGLEALQEAPGASLPEMARCTTQRTSFCVSGKVCLHKQH